MIVNQLILVFESVLSCSSLEKKLNKFVISSTIIANIKIPMPQPTQAITSHPFGAKLGNIAGAKATSTEANNKVKPNLFR